ncbi:Crp/Fnr family transcriptional regulator [Olsenella sp. Marseille-QA0557]|uniref:Crp/Fnr family transcriptional regulator n=1 Tax=Olsenella sp. Marseille-QA0557 TaxID=3378782 RepID=UPI003D121594
MDVLTYISALDPQVRDAVLPWVSRIPAGVLSRAHLVRLNRGEILVHMLDRCTRVYLLCSGRVRTTTHGVSGSTFAIDEFEAPAVFGEMEVLSESPLFHGSLIALTDCEFISARRDDYLAWLKSDPEGLLARSRSVVKSLLRQSGTERDLMGWTGVKRLMFVLCQYCRQQSKTGDVVIKASRSELAEKANVSTKTVSRSLDELEQRHMLHREGHKIVIDQEARARLDSEIQHEFETGLSQGK